MSPPAAFQVVDLHDSGSALTVQWRAAPGAHPRQIDADTRSRIGKQVAALEAAERRVGLARDLVIPGATTPAGPALTAAQRALGETLFELLDGPDRALTRRLDAARRAATTLHLVVRLRSSDSEALARHPALGWSLQLTAAPDGPLALAPNVTIAVQLGDAELAAPERMPSRPLRVLFMAYSPRNVEPVLDYEAEEERILGALAPFIEDHRLVLEVVEEGTIAELGRRPSRSAYDVIHLTGHGVITERGPRLVMETDAGDRDDVSAEQLLDALHGGQMPRLLVISSCHSADQRAGLPSLAAELIQGGAPCVVGWTRPVQDDVATDAAEVLYRRLCSGSPVTEAIAYARRKLDRADQSCAFQAHAWATLQLLTTELPRFAIAPTKTPRGVEMSPGRVYRMLGNRMRVLAEGFVGRRRELQTLSRILRHGRWAPRGAAEHAVAGALVVGMKGQGKSCLVGRAIDRHYQDTCQGSSAPSIVVLHGQLDELQLIDAFRTEAVRLADDAAERLLDDAGRGPTRRIERLLRHHWRDHRLVIVLDDFEQNLEIPGAGEARLSPFAAALLEVLLPVCRDEQPKLLVTSTARFALPAPLAGALAELPLGPLNGASIRKLWMRGRGAELADVGPAAWASLCERFGRNARLLDWARQLLAGKTPAEIRRFMDDADARLPAWPTWKGQPLDEAKADELVAAFLRHMAFADAAATVGPDAMTFIARARVYDVPVPIDAFAGLTAGLAISLQQHVPALANLGLLELNAEDGRAVYRVSPLVKPAFDAADAQRWHGVAADYWWEAATQGGCWEPHGVLQAWEHALAAKRQDIADPAAELLSPWLDECGAFARSAALAARHVVALPGSVAGLRGAGYAVSRAGRPREGRRLLERAMELARLRRKRCVANG